MPQGGGLDRNVDTESGQSYLTRPESYCNVDSQSTKPLQSSPVAQ